MKVSKADHVYTPCVNSMLYHRVPATPGTVDPYSSVRTLPRVKLLGATPTNGYATCIEQKSAGIVTFPLGIKLVVILMSHKAFQRRNIPEQSNLKHFEFESWMLIIDLL